jgi:hypothetical protein
LAEAHFEVEGDRIVLAIGPLCFWLRAMWRDRLNLTGAFLQLTATNGGQALSATLLLTILALEQPFAGITRIQPDAFAQLAGIFKDFSQPGADESR